MIAFEDYLKENLVLLDGAMGSLIYEKGVFIDKCYDELNLSRPELIKSIHEEYIRAGAKVIETNTYGANRFKLKSHHLLDQIEADQYQQEFHWPGKLQGIMPMWQVPWVPQEWK